MTLETFFEKFDELADKPDAVPRMRRFILDLAVQGKLVGQDPSDEPADELLKRVQTEKARLVKSGEIKKQEQLPSVGEDAIPFSLPAGWAASQLGDVAVCMDYMREPINGTERDLRIVGKDQSELFPYYGATQQQGWIDDFIFDAELVLLGEDGVPFFDDLRPKAYLISGKTWVNNHAHVFSSDSHLESVRDALAQYVRLHGPGRRLDPLEVESGKGGGHPHRPPAPRRAEADRGEGG